MHVGVLVCGVFLLTPPVCQVDELLTRPSESAGNGHLWPAARLSTGEAVLFESVSMSEKDGKARTVDSVLAGSTYKSGHFTTWKT